MAGTVPDGAAAWVGVTHGAWAWAGATEAASIPVGITRTEVSTRGIHHGAGTDGATILEAATVTATEEVAMDMVAATTVRGEAATHATLRSRTAMDGAIRW